VLILSPGPGNISERVRTALTLPDIGHRSAEFTQLLQECQSLLLQAAGVPSGYRCAILTGSGSSGIEAALTALPGVASGVLVLANGSYGDRAVEIAQTYGVAVETLDFGWTSPVDLVHVESKVRESSMDVVYLVHHETTTGMLNPLAEVSAIAKRHGKRVIVDAVSSIAGESMNLAAWEVDLAIGSANKCIRGVPGVGFAVVADDFAKALQGRLRVSYTADLATYLTIQERGETPFTPPVQVISAFREALRELLEEGVANRVAHYANIASVLRDGLVDLGLKLLLPRDWYSNTMTSIRLPEGFTYEGLLGPLKERGYLIYKGQGHLADFSFRLGNVGVMTPDDIRGFLVALRQVLRQ
jgi:2-aminoethylphosphonate-pyruvate transaminase